jgi:hypothetical protein
MISNEKSVVYLDKMGDLFLQTESGELFTLVPDHNVTDEGIDIVEAEVLRVIDPEDHVRDFPLVLVEGE